MAKEPFKAYEFDTIVDNSKPRDTSKYRVMPKQFFDEFVEYIEASSVIAEQQALLNFCTISYIKGLGRIIKVRNYVGLIQLESGYQIQILPKVNLGKGKTEKEIEEETKKIFLRMLQCLKDPTFSVFNKADVDIRTMNIMEVFIAYYIKLLQDLIKQDIKKAYISTEDNLNTFKGKLLVSQNIRYNLAHKERFFVKYDEYSIDMPINRIIKATLLKLQRLAENIDNNRNIRQLLGVFDEVAPSINHAKDFASIVLDRSTMKYDLLMKWSEVFLSNKSFSNFGGLGKSISLLFPMYQLFEDYVAVKFKRYFAKEGWKAYDQHKGLYIFDEPKKKFALRPDLYVESPYKIILDTKWKKLNPKDTNLGIDGGDIYQMYVYAQKYNTPHIVLLYPLFSGVEELALEKKPRFISYKIINGVKTIDCMISVAFIDLDKIEDSMKDIRNIIDLQMHKVGKSLANNA